MFLQQKWASFFKSDLSHSFLHFAHSSDNRSHPQVVEQAGTNRGMKDDKALIHHRESIWMEAMGTVEADQAILDDQSITTAITPAQFDTCDPQFSGWGTKYIKIPITTNQVDHRKNQYIC